MAVMHPVSKTWGLQQIPHHGKWGLLGGEGQMWVPAACLPPGPYQWGAHPHQPLLSPRFGPGPPHHPSTPHFMLPRTPHAPPPSPVFAGHAFSPAAWHEQAGPLLPSRSQGVRSLAMVAVRSSSGFIRASEHRPAFLVLLSSHQGCTFLPNLAARMLCPREPCACLHAVWYWE